MPYIQFLYGGSNENKYSNGRTRNTTKYTKPSDNFQNQIRQQEKIADEKKQSQIPNYSAHKGVKEQFIVCYVG